MSKPNIRISRLDISPDNFPDFYDRLESIQDLSLEEAKRFAAEKGLGDSEIPAIVSGLVSAAALHFANVRESLNQLIRANGALIIEQVEGALIIEQVEGADGTVTAFPKMGSTVEKPICNCSKCQAQRSADLN